MKAWRDLANAIKGKLTPPFPLLSFLYFERIVVAQAPYSIEPACRLTNAAEFASLRRRIYVNAERCISASPKGVAVVKGSDHRLLKRDAALRAWVPAESYVTWHALPPLFAPLTGVIRTSRDGLA